jgi:hypothetical protein
MIPFSAVAQDRIVSKPGEEGIGAIYRADLWNSQGG